MIRMTSLLLVEERLLEADYFAGRLARQKDSARYGYELNAFLSAARSVTFLLQKEFSKVEGFQAWWAGQRELLAKDPAARFFLELRNFSQKQGRVSIIGGGVRRAGRTHWTWRFAGTVDPVPPDLLHRDVVDCCREHLAKLATIVLRCVEAFPWHACPTLALTPEGVAGLGISPDQIDEALGLPRGWTETNSLTRDERIRLLRDQVDGLDLEALRKLANWKPRPSKIDGGASAVLGESLLMALVERFQHRRTDPAADDLVLGSLVGQIVAHDP